MRLAAHHENGEFKFGLLLACLFVALIVPSYFDGHPLFNVVWKVIFTSVLLAALYSLVGHKKVWFPALVLMLPTLATVWIEHFSVHNRVLFYLDNLTTILFLGFICYQFLIYVLRSRVVSANMIYASMCVYLMIGIIWAAIYSNINLFYNGAFFFANVAPEKTLVLEEQLMGVFTYYSYVTLTTLGYGDVVPTHKVAQSWATVEAMVGQFYIAVIMARLVSIHATQEK